MAVLFLDSSAVVKRYVSESGSQWTRTVLDPAVANEHHVSVVTGVGVISAIIRRRRIGSLDATTASAAISEFLDDGQYLFSHVAAGERQIDRAMKFAQTHVLRGYDAIQLVSAVALGERYQTLGIQMIFVSADDGRNAAAIAEGLPVENPDLHP